MPLTDDVVVRRKRRPRTEALEQRLAQILDVATRLFAEQGYTATSLREVAGEVGLSPAGLIHHFPDKAALLEAVLDHRLGVAAATFGLETVDGAALVRGLISVAERDVREPLDLRLFCVLSAEALSPTHPAHGYFRRWFHEVRENLTVAFVDLQSRGLFHGHGLTPSEAARQVACVRDGLHQQWLFAPDEIDLVAAVRASFAIYVDVGHILPKQD